MARSGGRSGAEGAEGAAKSGGRGGPEDPGVFARTDADAEDGGGGVRRDGTEGSIIDSSVISSGMRVVSCTS